jgi:ABC-type phosphate transport system substrate-binding protein
MNKLIHYILPAFLIVLLSLSAANKSNAQEQAIMVIANDKGAPAAMTMKELKSVMLGEKQRWADGTKVSIAFMKANTSVGSSTAKKIMGMTGDQLNKFWLALVFQGKAKAPVFYGSSTDVENYVAQNPGAIGVVEAGYTLKSGHVVTIDSKKTF